MRRIWRSKRYLCFEEKKATLSMSAMACSRSRSRNQRPYTIASPNEFSAVVPYKVSMCFSFPQQISLTRTLFSSIHAISWTLLGSLRNILLGVLFNLNPFSGLFSQAFIEYLSLLLYIGLLGRIFHWISELFENYLQIFMLFSILHFDTCLSPSKKTKKTPLSPLILFDMPQLSIIRTYHFLLLSIFA